MLYHLREAQRAVLKPLSTWADSVSQLYTNPYSPLAYTPFANRVSAGLELLHRLGKEYEKPEFKIDETLIDDHPVSVVERIEMARPFCRLIKFERLLPSKLKARENDPSVLVFAPLSGHHATLLRDTVRALLPTRLIRIERSHVESLLKQSDPVIRYLLQLLLRALGSNNLADCSDLCHAPSTIGLRQALGSGTSNVNLEGLQQADCVVLVGSNAPANHPRLMNELIRLRERGGTVIVINPVLEVGLQRFGSPAFPVRSLLRGSEIASFVLQPIPGSDAAVFLGIQKALQEQGGIAWDLVQEHSEGWQALIAQLQDTTWETICACCGLSRDQLERAAACLRASRAAVFAWAMGITHHANGVDNVQAIVKIGRAHV